MRMLIVGAGATGGYFGARLAAAGRDVSFLLRPTRAAAIRARGLIIESPVGDVTVHPRIVEAGAIDGSYDAILLTVKSFALEGAMADMAPAIGPETAILPVLNGMRHMDQLRERFGASALCGCSCKIASTLEEDGRIKHLARFHELAYGEMNGSRSERMDTLDGFMKGAGFDATLSPDIARLMWEKWVLLAALGALCCLMRGSVGQVEAAPGGRAFTLALFDEVTAIVRAVGSPPSESFLQAARAQLTATGSSFTSSMYRDLLKGAPLEADQIVGDLLQRGQAAGIAAPLLGAAYTHLSILQGEARAS